MTTAILQVKISKLSETGVKIIQQEITELLEDYTRENMLKGIVEVKEVVNASNIS